MLTLSYHRFKHVPTCTPPSSSYVPHRKFAQISASFLDSRLEPSFLFFSRGEQLCDGYSFANSAESYVSAHDPPRHDQTDDDAPSSSAQSSKQTMNNAPSTNCNELLLLVVVVFKTVRSFDHVLRFSVVSTPIAWCAASAGLVSSASLTMAWRLRMTSRSVRRGLLSMSRTGNQSVRGGESGQIGRGSATYKTGPAALRRCVAILS